VERGAAPTTCDMAMSIGTDVIAGSKRNSGRATPATAIDTIRGMSLVKSVHNDEVVAPQLDHAVELLKSWKVFKTLVAKRDDVVAKQE